jgi:hypothetical protein
MQAYMLTDMHEPLANGKFYDESERTQNLPLLKITSGTRNASTN